MKNEETIMDADDPRVTAYALGETEELSREDVRRIEELLEQDADFASAVEALRSLGGTLRAELGDEARLELLPGQRDEITESAAGAVAGARPSRILRPGRLVLRMAAAAGIAALAFGAYSWLQESRVARDEELVATGSSGETSREGLGVLHDRVARLPSDGTTRGVGAGGDELLKDIGYTGVPAADPILVDAEVAAASPEESAEEESIQQLDSLGYAVGQPGTARVGTTTATVTGAETGLHYFAPAEPGYPALSTGGVRLMDDLEAPAVLTERVVIDGRISSDATIQLEGLGYPGGEVRDELHANDESYLPVFENPFVRVDSDPRSTFSIDVDTASYSNMRRFLNGGTLPPADSVRIEELVNYFDYEYPQPSGAHPFSVTTEIAACPWQPNHRLLRIGLKGKTFASGVERGRNLVFLLDVSGSMNEPNKLPMVKDSMRLLLDELGPRDRVAIVVYAGASGMVLESTPASRKDQVLPALERLSAGGSTNGAAGIELAYRVAAENFIDGGINRVILATDGDFNVGVTDRGQLVSLITEKAKTGVFLTVLGYGMGNLKDSTMEQLANKGNGNYAYIDTLKEAMKVLVHEMPATLETIAKDVKLQLEFNPAVVSSFRLLGYENRVLAHTDFNDDTKDAGEIGAGHTVTALYELVPVGAEETIADVDPLKYQKPPVHLSEAAATGEALTLKLRYKEPEGERSSLIEHVVHDDRKAWAQSSRDFRFAAAVASFGMCLRNSQHLGATTYATCLELAREGAEIDRHGYRAEFIQLVEKAASLSNVRRR